MTHRLERRQHCPIDLNQDSPLCDCRAVTALQERRRRVVIDCGQSPPADLPKHDLIHVKTKVGQSPHIFHS